MYLGNKGSKLKNLKKWQNGFLFLLFLFCPFPNLLFSQSTDPEVELKYPIKEKYNYPFSTSGIQSPLYLQPSSSIESAVVFDPETNSYVFSEKIGRINYRPPTVMDFEEYQKYDEQKAKSDYWREKSREDLGAGPSFLKSFRLGNKSLDKVFGTDAISIIPQGSAELIFGYSYSKNDNPAIPVRNRTNGNFVFKEKIMMNVTGSIGDKLELGLNYNTEATFDFENKTKLEYSGKEDEIIKKIEAGDVSLTLPGTLITGSQGLFGIKTELQFGRLSVQAVVSHQRSESRSINVQGGAQETEFEIDIDKYDENRHFFLSHFFRDNYNKWLKNLPLIESQLQVQQIEVWVVNKQNNFTKSRNIVALMDLAEGYNSEGDPNFYADQDLVRAHTSEPGGTTRNSLNNLYTDLASRAEVRDFNTINDAIDAMTQGYSFEDGLDYVKVQSARPLESREYTINNELGYISLNSPLRNDEVLAVAFVFSYQGNTYQVGELSIGQAAPKTLIVKLLKGNIQSPKLPTFDLMMKNVYSMGAYQVSQEGFVLDVMYRDDKTGTPVSYLNEKDVTKYPISPEVNKQILLKVLNLDQLDSRNEPNPDGKFDFVEGVTIYSRNGRIFFPELEPFGSDLAEKIIGNPEISGAEKTAKKYVFQELYDSTKTKAKQIAEKNKFFLKGKYRSSSSSEIQLNAMNIPRGSVTVTAGGIPLTENQDYTVDYTLGRVKILNQGLLESGTPLKISLESNSLFNLQTKTLLGTHLDYRFSENFNIGATLMRLTERPLTEKVNMGDEPISNTMWGVNTSYRTESQLLTTIIDALPLLETKETSSIAFDAEFAHLIPGQSKAIDKDGIAYIDDFEGGSNQN